MAGGLWHAPKTRNNAYTMHLTKKKIADHKRWIDFSTHTKLAVWYDRWRGSAQFLGRYQPIKSVVQKPLAIW